MSIEYPEVGNSANDGKGEYLRTAAMMYNQNFRDIVSWVTGGSKTGGDLNKPLPVTQGGTGGSTAAMGRQNLGLVMGPNSEMVFGNNSIELYNAKYTIYGRVNNDFAFLHTTVGVYTLNGVGEFSSYGYKQLIPKDDLGNPLIGAVVTIVAGLMTVKTYAIKYVSGKATVDLSTPLDIPEGRFISLNVSKGL